VGISDVVDNEGGVCSFVVDFAERFEAFLADSIPKGDSDMFPFHCKVFFHDFYSPRGQRFRREQILNEACGDIGFPYSWTADDNNFVSFRLLHL
jgi:hypothetical protein